LLVLPQTLTPSLHDALPISYAHLDGICPGICQGDCRLCRGDIAYYHIEFGEFGFYFFAGIDYTFGVPVGGIYRYDVYTCINKFLDRKSTRLNSSHVKISYAV